MDTNTKDNIGNLENQNNDYSQQVDKITPHSPPDRRTSPLKQQPKISNSGQVGSSNAVSSRTVLQALGMKVYQNFLYRNVY